MFSLKSTDDAQHQAACSTKRALLAIYVCGARCDDLSCYLGGYPHCLATGILDCASHARTRSVTVYKGAAGRPANDWRRLLPLRSA